MLPPVFQHSKLTPLHILKPLILLAIYAVLAAPLAQAQQLSTQQWTTLINLSGKQRMLTQKMSKEFMLVALNIDKEKNIENLTATARLFDKTLTGLQRGDSELGLVATDSRRINRQLDKVVPLWRNFQSLVKEVVEAQSATEAQVASMASQNIPLLKQMNKAVGTYERVAAKNGLSKNPSFAITINLAGKQRMLTQKMSKEFLLIVYGFNVEDNKLNLLDTFTLFDRTLKGLQNGDEILELPGTSDETISEQLEVVSRIWSDVLPTLDTASLVRTSNITESQINNLTGLNVPLLQEMNKAVGMFVSQSSI